MALFKYGHIPNIDSYQCPDINTATLPLNHDLQVIMSLEYKDIPNIVIMKGEYLEYEDTIWSILGFACWRGCFPEKKLRCAKTGYMVRIPISIQSSIGAARDSNYKLSYKTWAVLSKPNFTCKQAGFLYLGFEVPLEDYIHDCKIIEKGKKMIEGMLELF